MIIIMMDEMAGWESIQIDYVLDVSLAPVDIVAYLNLQAGFHVYGEEDKYNILRKDLYGTRQAAANWFDMLKTELENKDFK